MNISMNEIINQVSEYSRGTKDIALSPKEFFMDSDGKICFKNTTQKYDLSEWALSQACNNLGMPTRYEKRLLTTNPSLLSQQFNYWTSLTDKPVLFRTKGTLIRGYLSTSYCIYDNYDLCETLNDIGKYTDYGTPNLFYMDDKHLHIRFVVDNPYNVGHTTTGLNDILKTGVDITNSEVGAASVSIVPMVYRQVCTNGLRAWRINSNLGQQSYRHLHRDKSRLGYLIGGAIESALDSNYDLLKHFIDSKQIPVKDPNKIIEDLLTKNKFSLNDIKIVQEEYSREPNPTKYGIINAITSAAKRYNNETRLEIESFAGKVLMSKMSW